MKIGPVTYYTHTGSDGNNDTQDELAFVLRETDSPCVDLVVFPVGGPVKFVQVCEFDADDPYLADGGSYVREAGDAPDFTERFKYSGSPEYAAALNRIRKERDEAPGNRREELKEQHKKQMAEVVKGLDEKNRPEGESAKTQSDQAEAERAAGETRAKEEAEARARAAARPPTPRPADEVERRR